jgi:hypothetical protein
VKRGFGEGKITTTTRQECPKLLLVELCNSKRDRVTAGRVFIWTLVRSPFDGEIQTANRNTHYLDIPVKLFLSMRLFL